MARLWERLSGWQQDQVEAAAKAELARLEGLLALPGGAPRLLAGRLTDRLAETGGEAMVTGPYGWLIRRGLVQRRSCTDQRCDDGIRLDTGGECENCGNVIHLRRAQRAKIAAEVERELPGLSDRERRRSLEEHEPAAGQDRATERWLRVELRAEQLDWLPPVLASLDRPFVIERPDELRDLVTALADRLASYSRQA